MTASRLRNSWMSARPGSSARRSALTSGPPMIEESFERSQPLHQPPPVEVAVTFVTQLVEQRAGDGEATAVLGVTSRHLPRELLVDWRSGIGERGDDLVAGEPERVLDGSSATNAAPMSENVGADLAKRRLEKE